MIAVFILLASHMFMFTVHIFAPIPNIHNLYIDLCTHDDNTSLTTQ